MRPSLKACATGAAVALLLAFSLIAEAQWGEDGPERDGIESGSR